jgi:WD40 repeat protein
MASLFISYSRKDIEFARKLTEAFKGQELDFWIDWEGIPPTVDWWKEIAQGIEEADTFLFLISPDSARSKVCGQEIEHAVKNGKRLVPIVVRDLKADEAPERLRNLNWIFLRDNDDFDSQFDKLITAIKTDYGWVQAHRQLQVKALEWEKNHYENGFLLHGEELQDAEFQLVSNSSKEPFPTALQHDYVLKSRQATDRQRRRTTIATSVAAVVMALLAVFAFIQADLATRRATIARAGELAAQSVALRDSHFDLALLLSVEAFQTADIPGTRSALLDNTQTTPQLLQYLGDQQDSAWNVTFSPDAKTLASSNRDDTILLWDLATVKPIGHPLKGRVMAFSPDAKTLATDGDDLTIILWDVQTQLPIGEPLTGLTNSIMSLFFSQDGKMLISIDNDNSVIRWDVETQQPTGQRFEPEESRAVDSVALSPNGETLAFATSDNNVILWDLALNQSIGQPLVGHTEAINSMAFSPDGKTLASGSNDDSIILWNIETHLPLGEPLRGHVYSVNSLEFSPDGKTLASGGNDNIIILWDTETHLPIGQPLRGHTDWVDNVAFSPDGTLLASGGEDEIILWNVTTHQPLGHSLAGHTNWVSSVAFSPDGKTLASSDNNVLTMTWDMKTLQPFGQSPVGYMAAFSADGKTMASVGLEGALNLWDWKTQRPLDPPLTGYGDSVSALDFSPDGKILALGNVDGTISLWDFETRQQIGGLLKGHTGVVQSLAFSPNGRILASGSADQAVVLWNIQTQLPIGQPLTGHSTWVTRVDFSPDGKMLASSSNEILLWDVPSGRPIDRPPVGDIAVFSPDGKTLAVGSTNTITLWDISTHQPIGRSLAGHADSVLSLAFSPDGKLLAAGDAANTVIIWNVDPQSWISETCQRVGRNLTSAEWQQYFLGEEYRKTCEQWPLETKILPTTSPTP